MRYVMVAAVFALGGCSSRAPVKPASLFAPVPERALRLEFDLRADSAFDSTSTRDVIADAIDQSVCLLRTQNAEECRGAPEDRPPACAVRSEAEIKTAVERAFVALRAVRLTSRFRIQTEVQNAMPGGVATVAVRDARRDAECGQWSGADGPCVAVKVDKLWILLRSPWSRDGVGRFDVFLAEAVCEREPN